MSNSRESSTVVRGAMRDAIRKRKICDSLSVRLFFRVLAVSAAPLWAAFFLGVGFFFITCPLPLICDPLAKTSDVNQYLSANAPYVRLKAILLRVEDVPAN